MREWWNGIHSRLKICRRKAYGFESRLSYQSYAAFVQRIGHDSSKVIMGVRFPHAAPVVGLLAHVG